MADPERAAPSFLSPRPPPAKEALPLVLGSCSDAGFPALAGRPSLLYPSAQEWEGPGGHRVSALLQRLWSSSQKCLTPRKPEAGPGGNPWEVFRVSRVH